MNTQATFPRQQNEITASGQTYDEQAHAATVPQILVVSNGHQWYGGEPAALAELLELLKAEPLDPTFEFYGNFVDHGPISYKTGKPLLPAGWVSFWGNFQTVSHVFKIVTNDAQAIKDLTDAILANQASAGYIKAREAIQQKRKKQFAGGQSLQASKS